jgi:hypothetical protein
MTRLNFLLASLLLFTVTTVPAQKPGINDRVITRADLEKTGISIPVTSLGEPAGSVKLYTPRWIEASGETPGYGVVEGSIFPVDPNGWPINFRVLLPAKWSFRAMQQGGGGMNGSITVREGRNPMLNRGFAIYGSDSGHQAAAFGGQGTALATGPSNAGRDDWSLNDEAIKNLGYMQMKKTHDAAMVIIERVYGMRPAYNYYIGGSQGGREGLMVAQRYPADYDGIISDVPIVGFSTLMLAPELLRIREKSLKSWVTPAKVNAIRNEFLRQCDNLDGLSDGIINNYLAARAIFNVTDGTGPADPWVALRSPDGRDPNPDDNSLSAKLTDDQIKTLEFIYSQYFFPEPFANGTRSFGMWMPTIAPDDFGTITAARYKGQEGADENARVHSSLGTLGVTGFMMRDVKADPLDYPGDEKLLDRRRELSEWLDATNPDLNPFFRHGGKIIITMGTMDFVASSGAQIDYYQSIVDKMGLKKLEKFARLYVVPHGGHGLSGKGYKINGNGESVEVRNIPAPASSDKIDMIISWVEGGKAPAKTLVVGPDGRLSEKHEGKGYLLCSYPEYPKYTGGAADQVSSYVSSGK